mgnify:CR=1 FL=1
MAKKVEAYIKLQVPAGQANPSPPVGPALGQHGLNIMDFCKAFNAQTQSVEQGLPIPVVITAYADRTFTFVTKTPPAAVLLRKAANISKGSPTPNTYGEKAASCGQSEAATAWLDLSNSTIFKTSCTRLLHYPFFTAPFLAADQMQRL